MSIKKILGLQSYWQINKELAREIGLEATLLLQHLVDLKENHFKKGTPFYQQQKRLAKELGLSEYQIRNATKKLVEYNFVSVKREGIPPKYHWTIHDVNLYSFFNLTYKDEEIEPLKVKKVNHKHKEKQDTNKNNNTNIDDVYGKLFFKLVDMYPKNRIGNRQQNLKKFKGLSIEECKLSLKNLQRYLDVAEGYNKSLSNYITEKVFTEEWLAAEEETKRKKNDITSKGTDKSVGVKKFNTDYDNF